MSKNSSEINSSVMFNLVPVKGGKLRTMGWFDILAIQVCWGIAAWFFLTGSQTGMQLGAKEAIPTILFCNCAPLFFCVLQSRVGARYGLEQFQSSINAFGHKLSSAMTILGVISIMIPNCMAALMFGQVAVKLVGLWAPDSVLASDTTGVTFWGFFCAIVGVLLSIAGPNGLKWFTRIAASGMVVVLLALITWIFVKFGFHEIMNAPAPEPVDYVDDTGLNLKWNRAFLFEANFGMGVSWAYAMCSWTRLAKSETGGYVGEVWGFGTLALIAGIFSALCAVAFKVYDPGEWVLIMGKDSYMIVAVLGLLMMAIANLSTIATVTYTMALSLRVKFPRLKWIVAIIICGLIPLPFINPDTYGQIAIIYSIVALLTTSYAGIIVGDIMFVSKGKINLREVFNARLGYKYWHGINPAALISLLAGTLFYIIIMNPATGASMTGWFPYITAGLPTFVFVIVLYTVLMKVWILKKYPITYVNDLPHTEEEKELQKVATKA